ncbi:HPt (Histidine-containing phosphotransfer) domain-containing protein [Arthrobacter sp. 9AX]|uniref:Hpt domain-containing protein n=1 Tax=Arthrobacter sp. 9AX TaxID=2653131 RepID=UPI0012F36182|nr:Hpt domain-containing protein [Arthrobacter sp. 9AX]VXB77603.1 HPt (Histidine-containing phosphotransfer) domain-containing protein [Arthrobacter sp. 9AX]
MTAITAPPRTPGGPGTGAKTPVLSGQDSTRPLLDHAVLDKLRADFDDYDEVWRVFVRNFIAALPPRIDKLRGALTTGDLAGAIDAVLSLKAASLQVGAERLASLALDLEVAVREGTRDRDPSGVLPWLAAEHLPRIRQRAGQTTYILEVHLKKTP